MSIITLTTDFGLKDYFVGAIKGAILSELPSSNIVDISHQISPFNIPETAYIIKNVFNYFTDGTIHIIGVDSEYNPNNKHVVIKLKNQYFICADNGILSFLLNDEPVQEQFELIFPEQQRSIFPVLEIFVKVAILIAKGCDLSAIGKPIDKLKILSQTQAKLNEKGDQLIGNAIYIDELGNTVFNISKNQFEKARNGRNYSIIVGSHKYKVDTIYNNYNDVLTQNTSTIKLNVDGTALALFNSANYFQVSIYKSNLKSVGGASTLLGFKYGSPIIINFF